MPSASSSFTCNTCSSTFETSEEQRSHMREPWHLHNLQLRMSELPALSLVQFHEEDDSAATRPGLVCPTCKRKCPTLETYSRHLEKHARNITPEASTPSPDISSDDDRAEEPEELDPTQCLFCNLASTTTDVNIDHMRSHGLFIPEPERLTDAEIFVTYLATIVHHYHECLFCGVQKNSVEGVQRHMKDKGHCMINLDAGSELLEFWDADSQVIAEGEDEAAGISKGTETAVRVSDTELRLASGTIVESRSRSLHTRHNLVKIRLGTKEARTKAIANAKAEAEAGGTDPRKRTSASAAEVVPSEDTWVAVRGEMGLVGVSEQQRRALILVEKKMQKRETISRAADGWSKEKIANKQKHYKPDGPGRFNG